MKVIEVSLDKLKKPEKNVRLHSDKQIKEFVRSVNMFGQIRPIVVDEDFTMLAGNGLYEALQQIGATEADVCVMTGLSSAQKKKLMLADNRIFNLGSDNMDVFDEIIAELGSDYDIPGYDEDLIKMLNASTGDIDALIENYGTFDQESRETMQNRAATFAPSQEFAPDQRNEGYQPILEKSPSAHYVAIKPEESAIPAEGAAFQSSIEPSASSPYGDGSETQGLSNLAIRYVICPKCGERIAV